MLQLVWQTESVNKNSLSLIISIIILVVIVAEIINKCFGKKSTE